MRSRWRIARSISGAAHARPRARPRVVRHRLRQRKLKCRAGARKRSSRASRSQFPSRSRISRRAKRPTSRSPRSMSASSTSRATRRPSRRAISSASGNSSAEIRDLYGLLIDGMQGTRGAIRSGGDGGGPDLKAMRPTQEPLARYSGVVKVGPDGKAHGHLRLPAFNGTVRLMAVAWSQRQGRRCGGDGRDRARSRRRAGDTAALPHFGDRRDSTADRQCRGRGRRIRVDLDMRGPVDDRRRRAAPHDQAAAKGREPKSACR